MKFLLFGTGDYYERYKKWFSKTQVLALLDNSPEKQQAWLDGIPVVSPEQGVQLPYDAIVILSFYVKTMKQQLLELGVAEEKIYHFYGLHKLFSCKRFSGLIPYDWPVQYYGEAECITKSSCVGRKKILLLSHDLNLGGPSLALYRGAQVLIRQGFSVVFASMIDGPLREKLVSEGIPVVVDYSLQVRTMEEISWIGSFSFLVCNTINFHVFLSKRDTRIPVLWWLHDSEFFYDGVDKELLCDLNCENMRFAAVGPVPERAIKKFLPHVPVTNLLYGVEAERCEERQEYKQERPVCFVTIGYIEARKGQDVLIKAVKRLPETLQRQAVFYLVGQNSSLMAKKLKEEIKGLPQVIMTGVLGREEIHRILNQAEAFICPSREDPMPTVAAEAMMHRVPCIISSAAGTSAYLQEKVNGMIFPSEDVGELSEKLRWSIEHREELGRMGVEAKKIFENYFSMDVFEKNFLELVEGEAIEGACQT